MPRLFTTSGPSASLCKTRSGYLQQQLFCPVSSDPFSVVFFNSYLENNRVPTQLSPAPPIRGTLSDPGSRCLTMLLGSSPPLDFISFYFTVCFHDTVSHAQTGTALSPSHPSMPGRPCAAPHRHSLLSPPLAISKLVLRLSPCETIVNTNHTGPTF